MTARTLRIYRIAASHDDSDKSRIIDRHTVLALIDEIDRLRNLVGETPSYMSDGSLHESLREMCVPGTVG
jgi:hypothetical protein